MTAHEIIPVPPDLGAVLAASSAYAEWAIAFPVPAPAPRVRRPGRIRRRAAALAAVTATAVLALAGCATHHAPAAAGTPWLPAQAAQVMHAAAHSEPAPRPTWDGQGMYPNDGIEPLCPATDAGHRAVAGSGADRFAVVCQFDGSEWAWGVAK